MFFNFKKRKNMKNKNWFTMIEIVMITIVLGLWILSIVLAANKFELANIRLVQNVIANNLAVQWIEWAYAADMAEFENIVNGTWITTDFCLNENEWTWCLNSWQYTRAITGSIDHSSDSATWYNICSTVTYTVNLWWAANKTVENRICSLVVK